MINKSNWYWWAGGLALTGGAITLASSNKARNKITEGAAKATEAVKNIINEAMNKKDFVKAYFPMAKEAEKVTGVPAMVTLAQAAIESGWGKSAPGFNFFGHKTGSAWTGEKQLLTTTEILATNDKSKHSFPEVISIEKRDDGKFRWRVKDWFRKYSNAKDAFIAHGNFLKNNKRYADAFSSKNDKDFAAAIHKAGYATDPSYTTKLHKMIDDFKTLIA